jgi:hypothetical protein
MNAVDVVDSRIDLLTASLNPAVRAIGGAQFSLMLSMISESHHQAQRLKSMESADALGAAEMSRMDLYTPEVVGELNRSLHDRHRGALHLTISWLDTVPLRGRLKPVMEGAGHLEGVPLRQAALLAKTRYAMIDEINDSRRQGSAMRISA